jgi:hypothetical protein
MTGIAGIVQTVPVLFCGGFGRVGARGSGANFEQKTQVLQNG